MANVLQNLAIVGWFDAQPFTIDSVSEEIISSENQQSEHNFFLSLWSEQIVCIEPQ
jgi:hypothetical protein